jgi:hypothetical protein
LCILLAFSRCCLYSAAAVLLSRAPKDRGYAAVTTIQFQCLLCSRLTYFGRPSRLLSASDYLRIVQVANVLVHDTSSAWCRCTNLQQLCISTSFPGPTSPWGYSPQNHSCSVVELLDATKQQYGHCRPPDGVPGAVRHQHARLCSEERVWC